MSFQRSYRRLRGKSSQISNRCKRRLASRSCSALSFAAGLVAVLDWAFSGDGVPALVSAFFLSSVRVGFLSVVAFIVNLL